MCLIIVKKPGIKMNTRILNYIRESSKHNSDGFGFALHKVHKADEKERERIIVRKYLTDAHLMIKEIRDLKIHEDDTLVVHLRMATHGVKSFYNTHPFVVPSDAKVLKDCNRAFRSNMNLPVIAHNGIFNNFSDNTEDTSDTYNFVSNFLCTKNTNTKDKTMLEVLYAFREDCISDNDFREKIHKFPLFRCNKLAILDAKKGLLLTGDNWQRDSHGILLSNKGSLSNKGINMAW